MANAPKAPLGLADGTSAGQVLALIATGRAKSRAELGELLGLSRATVTQRLDALFTVGLVREGDETLPSGGRPARALSFNASFGVALVADIGEAQTRVAVTDLTPGLLAEATEIIDLGIGPEKVLDAIATSFRALLERVGRPVEDVIGIGLSLPAPVDYEAAQVVGWSILTGWDGFDVVGYMTRHFAAPVVADNDVNVRTLAEHRAGWPDVAQMLFVKAGTGIGSGIVVGGEIYRGAQGAAGDIGHIRVGGYDDPLCRCGSTGCAESLAGGWALARDLRAMGFVAETARDVLALVQGNHPEAVRLLRRAGRVIGEVVADAVSLLNPSVVVLGGALAEADQFLISGTRELVYQRSLPLATRHLVIAPSSLGAVAGVLGAARLVVETQLSNGGVERILDSRRQPAHPLLP
jgi:predicted NBD/HSP70 family sugar kinase